MLVDVLAPCLGESCWHSSACLWAPPSQRSPSPARVPHGGLRPELGARAGAQSRLHDVPGAPRRTPVALQSACRTVPTDGERETHAEPNRVNSTGIDVNFLLNVSHFCCCFPATCV